MHDSDSELNEIRSVLLGDHRAEIEALRTEHAQQLAAMQSRVEELENALFDTNRRTKLVGEVLVTATADTKKQITPQIEDVIHRSSRADSTILADALYPVLGPAMRKMIAAMFSVDSDNAGQTFHVEQLLLIERQTGLVLAASATDQEMLEDADVVSGMMDAIRRFVQEAFDADDHDGLRDLRVGEISVLVEWGPQCVLASVIRGLPDDEYRNRAAELLENIHVDYGHDLSVFSGDSSPFSSASLELSKLQIETAQAQSPTSGKFAKLATNALALIVGLAIIALLIIGLWTVIS